MTQLYRNDDGVFAPVATGLPAVRLSSVAWGDYDADGDLDLVIAGSASSTISRVYRNDGGGAFVDIGAGLLGVSRCSLAWGDYDSDGDLDILLSGGPTATRIYRNDGGDTFANIGAGLMNLLDSSVAWGDYDNDRDLDVLISGSDGMSNRFTKLYLNLSSTANTVPAPPTNLTASRSGATATFAWDAAQDGETPAPGLSYNLRVGTTPGGSEISAPMADVATGYRRIPALGNANQNLSWTLEVPITTIYWAVQAVDGSFVGSPFAEGAALTPAPAIATVTDIDGDQGGWVRVAFDAAPGDDVSVPEHAVSAYFLWRRVDDPPAARLPVTGDELLPSRRRWVALRHADDVGAPVAPRLAMPDVGLLRRGERLLVGSGRFGQGDPGLPPGTWEVVGSAPAIQQPSYLVPAPTLADSTETYGVFWSVFVVTAHTATPSVWYASAPDSGYSTDDIAPGVPQNLALTFDDPEVALSWDPVADPDFQLFRLYRGDTSGYDPGPETLVHETIDTAWQDAPPNPSVAFYKLVAVDHAGNASDVASFTPVVGVSTAGAPRAFALHGARPNPFRSGTAIGFAVPVSSRVRLDVFDVCGRLVRRLSDGSLPPGQHVVRWDGRTERGGLAPAGVYFCRMEAGGFASSRRVNVMR